MAGKRWPVAACLGLLLAGSGCVNCGYQACKPALAAGPTAEVPLCDRREVYLVMVNGLSPACPGGLDGLRCRLADRGFTKMYSGELCHVWWLWQEMKRLHKEEPCARFVVLGYDFGCGPAASLARDAVEKEMRVDGLVLLNPVGAPTDSGCRVPTVVIRSGTGSAPIPPGECVCLPEASHFTLPSKSETVEVVYGLLKDSAARVEHLPETDEGMLLYDGAPAPRQFLLPGTGQSGDWMFLHDRAGTHTLPLSPLPYWPVPGVPPESVPGTVPPAGGARPLPFPRQMVPAP